MLAPAPPVIRLGTFVALGVILSARTSQAYTVESPVTRGCHERLTAEALAAGGWQGREPPAVTAADRVLADSLPFRVPQNADRWLLALLIGVRDSDLHGESASEMFAHPSVDLTPEFQSQHCLRSPSQDHSEGDAAAALACGAEIVAQLKLAWGERETLDTEATEAVPIALKFETRAVELPRFAYRIGRALHAIQDSYSHTFRSEDMQNIRGVFNFVEPALGPSYSESRDGAAHQTLFDRCDDNATPHATRRFNAALEASRTLLDRALASLPREAWEQQLSASVNQTLQHPDICAPGDAWCGAADAYLAELNLDTGCGVGGFGLAGPLTLIAMLLSRLSRRSRWRARMEQVRKAPRLEPESALERFVVKDHEPPAPDAELLQTRAARTREENASNAREPRKPNARRRKSASGMDQAGWLLCVGLGMFFSAPQAQAEAPSPAPLGSTVHAGIGASFDRAGGSVFFGAEHALGKRLSVGVTLELSPWADLLTGSVTLGTFNFSASGRFHWIRTADVEVSTVLGVGGSLLLFNTVSAPAGSFGPFLSLGVLDVTVPLREGWALVVSPQMAVSIPQLRGIPLIYRQYRVQAAIRWSF
jgi:hypothetical protein